MGRLRGSNPTSTLSPDADNAAVGSHHDYDFLQGDSRKGGAPVLFAK